MQNKVHQRMPKIGTRMSMNSTTMVYIGDTKWRRRLLSRISGKKRNKGKIRYLSL